MRLTPPVRRLSVMLGLVALVCAPPIGHAELPSVDAWTGKFLDCANKDLPGWPPPGGTFNTACLGVTPLMRVLTPSYTSPPGFVGGPYDDLDVQVTEIEADTGPALTPITSVTVTDGMLALQAEGLVFDGAEVVGSRWWLDAEHTAYITITEYSSLDRLFPSTPSTLSPGYQLEYRVVGDLEGQPICPVAPDGSHWAYLVGDVFVDVDDGTIDADPGAMLVACTTGALGKAITWGFAPWVLPPDPDTSIDLTTASPNLPLYQTGVRVVRADYCGDGESHTVDGVEIQVHNELVGQTFDYPQGIDEGLFGPDGALCVDHQRTPNAPPLACVGPCVDIIDAQGPTFQTWTKLAGLREQP